MFNFWLCLEYGLLPTHLVFLHYPAFDQVWSFPECRWRLYCMFFFLFVDYLYQSSMADLDLINPATLEFSVLSFFLRFITSFLCMKWDRMNFLELCFCWVFSSLMFRWPIHSFYSCFKKNFILLALNFLFCRVLLLCLQGLCSDCIKREVIKKGLIPLYCYFRFTGFSM